MSSLIKTEKPLFAAAKDLRVKGLIESDEPVAVFDENRIRFGIFTGVERCPDCGESLRYLCIEFRNGEEWIPALSLVEYDFPKMFSLFQWVYVHLTDEL